VTLPHYTDVRIEKEVGGGKKRYQDALIKGTAEGWVEKRADGAYRFL
jgi:hypothetical protein